jgi:hypothetical protein
MASPSYLFLHTPCARSLLALIGLARSQACFREGRRIVGQPNRRLTATLPAILAPTIEDCQSLCDESSCLTFNWQISNTTCYLYDDSFDEVRVVPDDEYVDTECLMVSVMPRQIPCFV